ncbi:MAG: PIG-L family deacetylase [Elusimicrobiota bacterium]
MRAEKPAHVFLSPHLDDAALSCGALIAQLSAAGQACLVVTVCAGVPPAGFVFSKAALRLHRSWGLRDETAVQTRLAEDSAAMALLGAQRRLLDFLDDMYRPPVLVERARRKLARLGAELGAWTRATTVDARLAADVAAALRDIRILYPGTAWYAPLGVGLHPDHLAVYEAARRLPDMGDAMLFYEDFPYGVVPGASARRLAEIGGQQTRRPFRIEEKALASKLSAISAYGSQVSTLIDGGAAAMPQAVSEFGERFWRLG